MAMIDVLLQNRKGISVARTTLTRVPSVSETVTLSETKKAYVLIVNHNPLPNEIAAVLTVDVYTDD